MATKSIYVVGIFTIQYLKFFTKDLETATASILSLWINADCELAILLIINKTVFADCFSKHCYTQISVILVSRSLS